MAAKLNAAWQEGGPQVRAGQGRTPGPKRTQGAAGSERRGWQPCPRALARTRARPRSRGRPARPAAPASSPLFPDTGAFQAGAGSAAQRWGRAGGLRPAWQPRTPGGFSAAVGRGGECTLKELGRELRGSLPRAGGRQELSRPGGEGPGREAPGDEAGPPRPGAAPGVHLGTGGARTHEII